MLVCPVWGTRLRLRVPAGGNQPAWLLPQDFPIFFFNLTLHLMCIGGLALLIRTRCYYVPLPFLSKSNFQMVNRLPGIQLGRARWLRFFMTGTYQLSKFPYICRCRKVSLSEVLRIFGVLPILPWNWLLSVFGSLSSGNQSLFGYNEFV